MRLFLSILFLFTCAPSGAQVNLVLNPSFEDHSQCPSQNDQIDFATYWSGIDSPGNITCTPEYLNVCGTSSSVSVPNNGSYYQFPRNGYGMTQVVMYIDEVMPSPYMRDYLLGRLSTTLSLGQSYCVSFYVSPEEKRGYFVDKIGAYLDDGGICMVSNCGSPQTQFNPQIGNTSGILADTFNWVRIEGVFISNGTERFITLGNFFDKINTSTLPGYNTGSPTSIYLIDDVSVIPSDLSAYAGPDVWVAEGDSIFIGRTPEVGLECYWYVNGNIVDSGAGITVYPDTTTTYVVQQTLCGQVKTDTVVVSVFPVSVNGITNSRQLSVYPNPASRELTVMQEKVVFTTVVILNGVGQRLSTHILNSKETKLDISSLPVGVYYLQLNGEKGREVRSFVKI